MSVDLSSPILIVDDTASVRRILTSLAKRIGFTKVDVAEDGTDALFKLGSKKYGLVISDWQMEPMDGYALLKAMRSDKALETIPFIMITVHSDVEKVVAAKNAGVNAFISKPFTAKTLRDKIVQAWEYQPRQSGTSLQPLDEIDLL